MTAQQLRSILGSYVTGVTIVTTIDKHSDPVGVTVNSFTSVSLDPPLVSWCLRRGSYSLPAFRHSRRFAINILGAAHAELCRRFAKGAADKWDGVSYRHGRNGCPVLHHAIATIECTNVAEHDAGDHVIMIGEVSGAAADHIAPPLVFFRGGYYELTPAAENAPRPR